MSFICCSTYTLSKNKILPIILEQEPRFSMYPNMQHYSAGIGWGYKETTFNLYQHCQKAKKPFYRIEEGFICFLAKREELMLSVVLDAQSIYYNCNQTSDLDDIIMNDSLVSHESSQIDAKKIISKLIKYQISKYNEPFTYKHERELSSVPQGCILIIDQTFADASLKYGGAEDNTFSRMLQTALQENPGKDIFIKVHPKVITGEKKSCFSEKELNEHKVLSMDINPIPLLRKTSKVYCVTSQMGFEALMLQKKVVCFGLPFYAQLGLTDDRHPKAIVKKPRSFVELFIASYMFYPKYIDVDRNRLTTLGAIINKVIINKKIILENHGEWLCVDFSPWKKDIIYSYLKTPYNSVKFMRSMPSEELISTKENTKVAIWGYHSLSFNQKKSFPVLRVEDGFLRSVGLGSDLVKPNSLVFENQDLYFCSKAPSTLEDLLNTKDYSSDDLDRAVKIIEMLKQNQVSKYNFKSRQVPKRLYQLLDEKSNKKIILVVGQVEEDQSINLGSPVLKTNLELVIKVKDYIGEDGFIIFKEHPDLTAKNRINSTSKKEIQSYCDYYAEDNNLHFYLNKADQVHTMTSLVGFEALLLNKRVIVWGQPFYAGWGLTKDIFPIKRRQRTRSLTELVAATLIDYPRYFNWNNETFTTPEFIIELLAKEKEKLTQQSSSHTKFLNICKFIRGRAKKILDFLKSKIIYEYRS